MILAHKKAYRDQPILTSSIKIIQWLQLDCFQPERAMTSHFVSSKTLFGIRLIFAFYSAIVMWTDIIYTAQTGGIRHFFVYFTDLTFIGLHSYLITTCIHHARYLYSGVPRIPQSFMKQPSVFNYLYIYLYHTVITYNILTPVVFWSLLAQEKLFKAHLSPIDFWISISVHTVTLFIVLIEVVLNRMLVNIRVVLLVFVTLILYMCLVFIVFACEQWWVYSFLDWRVGPGAIVWYILVLFLATLCFFFQSGLHYLRDKIAEKPSDDQRLICALTDRESSRSIQQSLGFHPLASSIVLASSTESIETIVK